MNESEIRAAVLRVLGRIAPEADLQALDPMADFRDQLDIDSMDFLNFMIGLQEETGVEVPERDYPKMSNLQGSLTYLASRADAEKSRLGRKP